MKICAALLTTVIVVGCSERAEPEVLLTTFGGAPTAACPQGAHAPLAPPAPRTVDAIARYANALADAHHRTEVARAECARRLARMSEWAHNIIINK